MFIFITSLKHPKNCYSYERVGYLLDKTLQSVCQQTDIDFKVLVVCNQIPDIKVSQHVEFIEVDFPAPSHLDHPHTGMDAIRVDRGSKYMAGLIYARRYDPLFIMFFDADDFISNQIVEFVAGQTVQSGWYIDSGYQYQFGDSRLTHLPDFYFHCGTSLIYPYRMLDIPEAIIKNPDFLSIQQHTDGKYLKHVLGSHRLSVSIHQSQGHAFNPVPFPAAIWMLGNGENHSGKKGKLGDLPINKEICDEFSFYPEQLSL
ncbi:MAG: glycosyltransferase family 2 protein [Gammaproteobacteria bacterium]|nr:glycosyltransferase family 2 protein [Gammaproteobacteria bacterium]